MFYVYLLESISSRGRRYVGLTSNLKQRLQDHNSGKSSYTSQFTPWQLTTYVAFSDKVKAASFERYLKSGSVMLSPTSASGNGSRGLQRTPTVASVRNFGPGSSLRAY